MLAEFEREEARTPTDTGPVLRAWEKHFARASTGPYPEVRICEKQPVSGLTLFHCRLDGQGYLEQLWVAIPDRRVSADNYLAVAVVSRSIGSVYRSQAVAYSRSVRGRMFVAHLVSKEQGADLFEKTVQSYEWGKPFNPDRSMWPHMYEIRARYPHVSTLQTREPEVE